MHRIQGFAGLPVASLPAILFLSITMSIGFIAGSCNVTGRDLNVLVVTGGHAYDTLEFREMFHAIEGIRHEFALKPEAWKKLEGGERFDAIVFYDMWMDISSEEQQLFLDEFEKGTGMVFLHHSLVSHQEWPEYSRLVGGKYYHRRFTPDTSQRSKYRHDITLQVHVKDPSHPVTRGMSDFEIFDEGYSRIMVRPGVRCLLETDHPDCHPCIGWAHEVYDSRVVYLMGGHDRHAYANEHFRQLIQNAILWTGQ